MSWWREAVVYQIYVRSFADSDGDGVGDLAGARERLPHLVDLGVDAIWLTPFYPSPMADGGYDVADPCGVDPLFGDLEDFDALLAEAHDAGLKVLVDVVPNHTSDRHPWFAEAVAAGPGSAERGRYLVRDGRGDEPPNDWESVFGGPAWTRLPDGQWYLHLFAPEQPDLNWRNPQVRADFRKVLKFWLDRGVDGFRIDVAHGMIKHPDLPDTGLTEQISLLGHGELPYFDQDEVHEIYRDWRVLLDSYSGGRIGVAEAWASTQERLARYVRPEELHQAFNFALLEAPWSAAEFREVVTDSLATTGQVGATTTWVLGNHDVRRPVTRYGGGELGLARARAAALFSFALPGSVYVYQGEELGLREVLELPDELRQDPIWSRSGGADLGRDGSRVPMPWSGEQPPFGFGPGGSWLPAPAEWSASTVEAQRGDPGSVLRLYREALARRRALPALGDGDLTWLDAPEGVLAFAREPGFTCATNFGDTPVSLDLPGDLLIRSDSAEEWRGTLPPNTAVWLKTGKS
ncbi:glycoside hydrolase family 13 protein [Saccharopolyspora rhizosphaerae]|uniref:Glycoside hydrolase family 13 protein n=1 Tax=Saccharopolyspora rhizosphaerae TaxID=2492662 RepID=A0A3R8Q1E8_9PSEU|nr:glycoside hydrolase family 13 protein [Saccharopolyspora rhizosphaerae]RRO14908.1 glycoside hydrolase family 13 protein [Saccharopolyspora rhizosphaerae]